MSPFCARLSPGGRFPAARAHVNGCVALPMTVEVAE